MLATYTNVMYDLGYYALKQQHDLHKGNLPTTGRTQWLRKATKTPNIKIQS